MILHYKLKGFIRIIETIIEIFHFITAIKVNQ